MIMFMERQIPREKAPEKASNNAPYDHFEILAEGITKLSVYPKYNPRIKQTFMLRVGGKGSQDISDMDVSLSKDTFIYDGNACKPEVTVSYRKDTVLEQGIDYTISYEKNVNAGTATAVISGKGLFYGKIRKDFTIQKTGEESHIHEVVIDEAVAATCTRDGVTEGSHCLKCGEVLEEQTVIPAMGHQYAGGTCERCGDILYIEIDGVRYTKEEDLSGNVTIHVCAKPGEKISGKVNIPAEVAMGDMAYTVTVIDANAFADQTELTYVTLPKTITNIGNKAFAGCTALEGMKFKAKIAPEAAEDAWEGAGTEDFTILTPKNARDYYNIKKYPERQFVRKRMQNMNTICRNLKQRHRHVLSRELSNITFAGTVTRCMQMRMAKNAFCSQKLICSHWDMNGSWISRLISRRRRRRRAKSPFTAVGVENVPTS